MDAFPVPRAYFIIFDNRNIDMILRQSVVRILSLSKFGLVQQQNSEGLEPV